MNKEIRFIACGDSHSSAVALLGEIYTWGPGSYYRLGHGDDTDLYLPKEIEVLKKKQIQMIACAAFHNLCCNLQGEVFSWGSSKDGRLGLLDLKDTSQITTPRQITRLEGSKVTQVACSDSHSLCITANGEVFSWGSAGDLKLGYKSNQAQPFPKKVPGVEGVSGLVKNN